MKAARAPDMTCEPSGTARDTTRSATFRKLLAARREFTPFPSSRLVAFNRS